MTQELEEWKYIGLSSWSFEIESVGIWTDLKRKTQRERKICFESEEEEREIR